MLRLLTKNKLLIDQKERRYTFKNFSSCQQHLCLLLISTSTNHQLNPFLQGLF